MYTVSFYTKVTLTVPRTWLQRMLRMPATVSVWERRWWTFDATLEQAKWFAQTVTRGSQGTSHVHGLQLEAALGASMPYVKSNSA